eukprot:7782639-Ditylum_brightwellii.AAC.1
MKQKISSSKQNTTTALKDPADIIDLSEKSSVENNTKIALKDPPPAAVETIENPLVKTKTTVASQDPTLEVSGLPSK